MINPIDPAIIGPEANYLSLQNYEYEGFCPVFGSLVQGYQVTWLVCGNVQWEDYNPNDIKEWLSDWPDLQSGLEFGDLGPVLLIVEPDGSSYIAWLPIGSDSISVQVNINAELDGSAQAFFDTHLRDTFGRLFRRMLADAGIAVSGVYFADDFSHPGGWPVVQEDELGSGYENDGYTMFASAPDQLFVITPKVYGQVADMRVSADITQLEAGNDNEVFYGVVCRYQDLDNFYMFRINGYGSYSAAKVVNNEFTFFGEKNWFYNPDPMRPPGNVNTLRADCIGETLTFYINDIQVMQVTDPDLSQGTYGVVLGTIKTDYAKVRYDAFLVEQP